MILIVQINEFSEMQMSGQRGRFLTNTLHQIAIAADCVGIVIDDLVSRPVVPRGKPSLGDRKAHAVAESLPKRPRGNLHAWRQAALRVTGGFAPPLSKMFDLVQRQVVPGEVQQTV